MQTEKEIFPAEVFIKPFFGRPKILNNKIILGLIRVLLRLDLEKVPFDHSPFHPLCSILRPQSRPYSFIAYCTFTAWRTWWKGRPRRNQALMRITC